MRLHYPLEFSKFNIFMKKTLRMVGMAIMAILMCVNFSSCSSDDDGGNPIVGKYKLVSVSEEDGDSNTDGWYEFFEFKADGTFVDRDSEEVTYGKYTVKGNYLHIDWNIENGIPDDVTDGTYTISGNTLTYVCKWADGRGEWQDDYYTTYVLKKQ